MEAISKELNTIFLEVLTMKEILKLTGYCLIVVATLAAAFVFGTDVITQDGPIPTHEFLLR